MGPISTALQLLADRGASVADLIEAAARMEEAMPRLFVPADSAAAEPKATRRSKIPDGFPDEAALNKAREYWAKHGVSDADAVHEADRFRAFHESRGTLAANWLATWKTWYVKRRDFSKAQAGSAPQNRSTGGGPQYRDERSAEGQISLVREYVQTGRWMGRQHLPPDDPKTRLCSAARDEFDKHGKPRLL